MLLKSPGTNKQLSDLWEGLENSAWRMRVRILVRFLMVFRWNTEQLVVTTEEEKKKYCGLWQEH